MLRANRSTKVCRLSDLCLGSEKECCSSFVGLSCGVGVVLFLRNDSLDNIDLILVARRGSKVGDVSIADMTRLEAIHPHIEAAYQRVLRLQTATCVCRSLEEFVSALPLPTVLLDWRFLALYHNRAEACLAVARWRGTNQHLQFLKTASWKYSSHFLGLLAEMQMESTHALRADTGSTIFRERVVAHPSLPEFQALLSMRAPRAPHFFERPRYMIHFRDDGVSQGRKLAAITRLSEREREIALLVGAGKSNQEIADALAET